MAQHAAFWDRIAEKYAARPVDDEAAYAATLERVRHWLSPDMSVMEFGCGTGTTAIKLADAVAQMLGTDISGEMIRIARDKETAQDNLRFEQADAETAGAGQTFDVVMGFNILHLVADRDGLLTAVRARLEPGGLFMSKTPCLSGKPWMRPLILVMRLFGKAPPVVTSMSPAQLEAEIVAAGFEIVETGDYPKSLPNHFVVARAV